LKDLEVRLISELVANSRRSDRELAKALGVSQPTVSRIRMKLEKEGMIEYSGTPNLVKLGYELIAVVLGKMNLRQYPDILQKVKDFTKQHPNVIFVAGGIGLGFDRILISIHKDYADYSKFMSEIKAEAGDAMEVQTFLISLTSKEVLQHLSMKNFAKQLVKEM
jgi:DNA-binding Lrp family transcriptional regulator